MRETWLRFLHGLQKKCAASKKGEKFTVPASEPARTRSKSKAKGKPLANHLGSAHSLYIRRELSPQAIHPAAGKRILRNLEPSQEGHNQPTSKLTPSKSSNNH